MKIFVAASYSAKVNYDTGEVFPEYKAWLEETLRTLEGYGHEVICALREDKYQINDGDPAAAFVSDLAAIKYSDVLLALLDDQISAGVQTELGYALALGKRVILVHAPEHKLPYINSAMVKAGLVLELALPLDRSAVARFLS